MKGYFVYEGPIKSEQKVIDNCKLAVNAANKKDAINKIIYRYKMLNGYEREDDIRIDENLVIGGEIE